MLKNIFRTHKLFAIKYLIWLLLLSLFIQLAMTQLPAYAHPYATQPPLGTAASFAVLGASTVTNTGPTVVNGNLGVSPGTAVTGFPPGNVNGAIHAADAVALQAQSDVTTAYVNAAGQPCNTNLTSQDLGGKTLIAGVYCFSSSAQLTGPLVLNGQGDPSSIFIFQIGSLLNTASNASVSLINGAQACNIFWQVGSSATLGTDTSFAGNILALTSIAFTTGAISNGSLYARNGAVTLDTNTITASPCATATPTATSITVPTTTPITTPGPSISLTPSNPTHGGISPIGGTPVTSGNTSPTNGIGGTYEVGHTISSVIQATNTGTAGTSIPQTPIIISYIIPRGEAKIHAIGYGWGISLTSTTSPTQLTATFLAPFPINAGAMLAPIIVTGVLTKAAVPSFTTTASIYMPNNISPNTVLNNTIFVKKPSHNHKHSNNNNSDSSNNNSNNNSESSNNNSNNNSESSNNNSNNNSESSSNSHDHNNHHSSNNTSSGTSAPGTNLTRDTIPGMPFTGGNPN